MKTVLLTVLMLFSAAGFAREHYNNYNHYNNNNHYGHYNHYNRDAGIGFAIGVGVGGYPYYNNYSNYYNYDNPYYSNYADPYDYYGNSYYDDNY